MPRPRLEARAGVPHTPKRPFHGLRSMFDRYNVIDEADPSPQPWRSAPLAARAAPVVPRPIPKELEPLRIELI
jgi:hypothetical protein